MEGGAAVLRSSSSSNSVPNSKYQQQRMRSQSATNASKNHNQIGRFNSMLLDQNTIMMMAMMEQQYPYPHRQYHPQYQYQRGGGGGGGGGGIFLNPPISLASSPSLPPIPPRVSSLHNNHEQPPLLPLPVSKQQRFRSLPPKRSQSLSPTKFNKTPAKVIDENGTTTSKKLSPKQSQPKNNNSSKNKKMDSPPSKAKRSAKTRSDDLAGMNPSGPEPESLPKDVSKVLLPVVAGGCGGGGGMEEQLSFPGIGSSIFSLAPPPSSLPLPKFSILRPKLISCIAQAGSVTATAAGGLNVVDTGATDNLCKLLNLR